MTGTDARWTTLEQEREEVLEAVLRSLAENPDDERDGACIDLLRHLTGFRSRGRTLRVS